MTRGDADRPQLGGAELNFEELLESWLSGNRKHVVKSLVTRRDAVEFVKSLVDYHYTYEDLGTPLLEDLNVLSALFDFDEGD